MLLNCITASEFCAIIYNRKSRRFTLATNPWRYDGGRRKSGDNLIDLHCHLLPGIDDGAKDLEMSLAMARMASSDGISTIACTPHILPGVYNNTGPAIRGAVARLRESISEAGIPIGLVTGADVHIAPDLGVQLRDGRALTLNDSRYLLLEPPHHVLPPRLEELIFGLQAAGYVPILTHPERLSWIEGHYDLIERLVYNSTSNANNRRIADGSVWPATPLLGRTHAR